jgi:hypothetical protein
MLRASSSHGNFGAAIAVVVLFLLAQFVAPHSHLSQSQLSCGQPARVITSFPDIKACDNDPRYLTGCACGPIKNPLSDPYHFWLTPLLMGLLGYILLKGSIPSRLTILNSAVVFAWALQFVFSLLKDPKSEIAMALLFVPILAAVYCTLVSAWFLVSLAIHSLVKRLSKAT